MVTQAHSWNLLLDGVEPPYYRGIVDLLIMGADKARYMIEREGEPAPRYINAVVGHTGYKFVRVGGVLVTEEHTQFLYHITELCKAQSIAEKGLNPRHAGRHYTYFQ